MTKCVYRWVLMRRPKEGYAAHLCHVEMTGGIPTYVSRIFDPSVFRKARFEANGHNLIKVEPNGIMRIITNPHKTTALCRMCGGLMYRQEALRGDTHIGCSLLLTLRSGGAKQGDKPFSRRAT